MSATNKGRKRKAEDNDKDVEIGTRIKMMFADRIWYEIGDINKVTRGKGGEIVKVVIRFDDGAKEERDWPDANIVVDSGANKEEKKDRKRSKREANEGSPRMFVCGEEGCEYESKWKSALKYHKAATHDIDVTYYVCNADGCDTRQKTLRALGNTRLLFTIST